MWKLYWDRGGVNRDGRGGKRGRGVKIYLLWRPRPNRHPRGGGIVGVARVWGGFVEALGYFGALFRLNP
ncbi:MAG: hypothetical protein EBQ92_00905 [Proteobacteria bacterium]|nr:hypothetical protein [Pseudomonadota bacterium]